ncbi:hypothetical protein H4582DRAFT_1966949 [Lactarius indigo]|nr:hypothetical protein H4582DRAFT_1966949 [Lactarius indigo]
MLSVGLTFCHLYRHKTPRPKMRCMLIKASTDEQCCNLFCGLRIEKRYPQLTLDRTAEDFESPACRNYCNCSLCLRERGEAYVPELDGRRRSWVARQGGSHRAAPSPASESKSREPVSVPPPLPPVKQHTMKTITMKDAQVFYASWNATVVFTSSGESLGGAFLHGNKARIVPISRPSASPPAATTAPTAPAIIATHPIPESV